MSKSMPPATALLWELLKKHSALGGFYLIGGTALALRLNHRQSEDLDFAWPGLRLPKDRVASLVLDLNGEGWRLERCDSEESYDEFLIAGMELHDYPLRRSEK